MSDSLSEQRRKIIQTGLNMRRAIFQINCLIKDGLAPYTDYDDLIDIIKSMKKIISKYGLSNICVTEEDE